MDPPPPHRDVEMPDVEMPDVGPARAPAGAARQEQHGRRPRQRARDQRGQPQRGQQQQPRGRQWHEYGAMLHQEARIHERLPANPDLGRWSRDSVGRFDENLRFQDVDSRTVMDTVPNGLDAGKLESTHGYHWCAPSPSGRPMSYVMKGVADQRWIQGLSNTILNLCRKEHASVYNIRIELEHSSGAASRQRAAGATVARPARGKPRPKPWAQRRKGKIRHRQAAAAQAGAGEREDCEDESEHGESEYDESEHDEFEGGNPEGGNPEDRDHENGEGSYDCASDEDLYDCAPDEDWHHNRQSAPSDTLGDAQPTEPGCLNCGAPGHALASCPNPSPDEGSIKGCPVCDDTHELDNCPLVAAMDPNSKEFLGLLMDVVLEKRQNMPQIQAATYTFFDVLDIGCSSKFPPKRSVMSTVARWPWSNAFAKKVATANPGDDILQGKLHPLEFDHSKHTFRDLPEDPLFKGKTMYDIIKMRERGALNGERFISDTQKMMSQTPLNAQARLSELVRRLLRKVGGLGRDDMVLPSLGTGRLIIKSEDVDDAEMLLPGEDRVYSHTANWHTVGAEAEDGAITFTGSVDPDRGYPVADDREERREAKRVVEFWKTMRSSEPMTIGQLVAEAKAGQQAQGQGGQEDRTGLALEVRLARLSARH